MNKKLMSIAAAAALSLPWMGCHKPEKLNEPSTSPTPTGPVELKLKWLPDEHVVMDMDTQMTMEMSIPSQPTPIQQNMTMGQKYGLTVLKATPNGGHEVELEFLNSRMKMGMAGKTMMDYDSAKKSPDDKKNPAAEIFGKIIGSKIRYFLNATNGVDRLEGVDEMIKKLTSGPQASAMAPLKGMFSDVYFKQMMSQNLFLPPKAVQPGDTWPVQIEFPMGAMGTVVTDYKFTFNGWELHGKRNCARLDFQGTLKARTDSYESIGGMSITSLEGTSSGSSWFDPDLGIIIDTTMNQDMKMAMDMPTNPYQKKDDSGKKQSMTTQINQTVIIKLVSVK